MTYYFGNSGRQYKVGKHIASGGEGDIYDIAGNPSQVLKIFKDNKKSEKEEKIKVMLKRPVSEKNDFQITWPKDIVYTGNKRFAGYVMNKISSTENLNILYEYGPSAKYKSINWVDKITIALNLCIVLDAVHMAGHVCGDLNPNNINVDVQTGYVTYVDTDSYNIIDGSRIYRCPVGMPNYIAGEISKKISKENERNRFLGVNDKITLENASLPTYTRETDYFALAIHIFQLLMNGAHPYQGAIDPSAKSSYTAANPPDNIKKGTVPYINPKNRYTMIPRYAPEFGSLPENIQTLFKRAFIHGSRNPSLRPTASEWYSALDELKTQVVQCNAVAEHQYYNKLLQCPLCEADRRYASALSEQSYMPSQQIKTQEPIVRKTAPVRQHTPAGSSPTVTYKPVATTGVGFRPHTSHVNWFYAIVTIFMSIAIIILSQEWGFVLFFLALGPIVTVAIKARSSPNTVILPVLGVLGNAFLFDTLGLPEYAILTILSTLFVPYCFYFSPNWEFPTF